MLFPFAIFKWQEINGIIYLVQCDEWALYTSNKTKYIGKLDISSYSQMLYIFMNCDIYSITEQVSVWHNTYSINSTILY